MRGLVQFLFPNRLHRLSFFLRLAVLNTAAAILYVVCSPTHSNSWWAAIVGFELYGLFFILVPRVRDIGLNGWWVLMMYVPVANIVFSTLLLFRPPVYLKSEVMDRAITETPSGAI